MAKQPAKNHSASGRLTGNVLEGLGKLYLADDSSLVAEQVSYHLVKPNEEWLCESLHIKKQLGDLHVNGSPIAEVVLELEDRRRVAMVGNLRISGIQGLRPDDRYDWMILSGPDA